MVPVGSIKKGQDVSFRRASCGGSGLGLRQRLRLPGSLSESDRERGEGVVFWTRSRGGLGAVGLGDGPHLE